MNAIVLLPSIFGVVLSFTLKAQVLLNVDLKKSTPQNCEIEIQNEGIKLINTSKKTALLWLDGVNFNNGIIELDLKGKDVRGESFLGVAFHALNDSTYSAVYFRPFNFASTERKRYAVQYIDLPGHDWNILRDKHPGMYESAVNPVPDPTDWFHAKIVVNFPEIKVYVNQSAEPSLVVKKISTQQNGKIALWMDSRDGWFRNLQIVNK
ncbi:MAG TPA: family 16 glycoside hydrolase [Cyclobacteriaceae bacterium]|nr:family 16 glycoside hydrolase [Cyclobacteriaceae bacterium]